jgi:tellurite resistance protein TehA-like permease
VAEDNERRILHPRGQAVQWTGLLAGPAAWALHMQANYSLVPWVCKNGGEIFIHLVTVAALLITAVGAFAAWRAWQEKREAGADGEDSRSHFMGALGLLMSGLFFVVIVAQEIPSFIFHPCQR